MHSLLTADREPAPSMRFYATYHFRGGSTLTPMDETRERPDYLPASTYQEAAAQAKARYRELARNLTTLRFSDGDRRSEETVFAIAYGGVPIRVDIRGRSEPVDHGDGSGSVTGGIRSYVFSEIPDA